LFASFWAELEMNLSQWFVKFALQGLGLGWGWDGMGLRLAGKNN
jgi:hypothetical protein